MNSIFKQIWTITLSIGITILVFSCANIEPVNNINTRQNKQQGLLMEIGQRQGFQFTDTANKEYNFRYYTICLQNDTTVPIFVEYSVLEEALEKFESLHSKMFIFPSNFCPNQFQFDDNFSEELKKYLATEDLIAYKLKKMLNPKEKLFARIGILTSVNYKDPSVLFIKSIGLLKSFRSSLMDIQFNDSISFPVARIRF